MFCGRALTLTWLLELATVFPFNFLFGIVLSKNSDVVTVVLLVCRRTRKMSIKRTLIINVTISKAT